MKKNLHIETLAVQAGWEPKNGEPRVAPIAQSTTFKYDTAEELAKLFDLEISGHFYTRLSNPTVEVLEKKMAALEGGVGAIACSSGQSATSILVTNLCEAGDHIVSAGTIYGGTSNLLGHSFKKLGIETTFVDQDASEEEIFAAVRPNTKLIFGESLSNPSVKVLDFEKFASCDGLTDTRKPYILADREVNVLVRIRKWQHTPVYAVAAVTLRRVVDADVREAAEHLLAGSRILTCGAIARALRIQYRTDAGRLHEL